MTALRKVHQIDNTEIGVPPAINTEIGHTEADIKLAEQIVDAMKAYDGADAVRKVKAVVAGKLLAEAHKRHPSEEAFKKFLQLAGGIHIRRAQDLIAIALGRKEFEQHRAENAAAQQRHRGRLKAEKIELEKAKGGAAPKPEPEPAHYGNAASTITTPPAAELLPNEAKPSMAEKKNGGFKEPEPKPDTAPASSGALSSGELLERFEIACNVHLPRLNISDLKRADEFFRRLMQSISAHRASSDVTAAADRAEPKADRAGKAKADRAEARALDEHARHDEGGSPPMTALALEHLRHDYRIVVADPPWNFRSNSVARPGRNARRHYVCMSLAELSALPVEQHIAENAALFLWVPGPFLAIGAHLPLMEAWGFKPSGMGFVWVKLKPKATSPLFSEHDLAMGGGFTTRKNAEFCLIGRHGRSVRRSASVHEVIIEPRREHSRKPEKFYARIRQYSKGPRLELFGRQSRSGFDVWGNERDLFDEGG